MHQILDDEILPHSILSISNFIVKLNLSKKIIRFAQLINILFRKINIILRGFGKPSLTKKTL